MIGALVFVFFVVALSGFTKAWLLYLGLFFLAMVLYAPGGLASLLLMQIPVIRARRFGELVVPYLLAGGAALVALAGLIGIVEMVYRLSEQGASTVLTAFGVSFDATSATPWAAFGLMLGGGLVALRYAARLVGERWGAIQSDLQGRAA